MNTNYFNAQTRTNHILLLAMQEVSESMANNSALTADEQKWLKTANTYIKKFNASVFERFGEAYKRKIVGTMQTNDLRLISKYSDRKECISYCATEDIAPKVADLQFFHCMECERCDYKDCAVYALSISCDVNPQGTIDNNEGCPYKM